MKKIMNRPELMVDEMTEGLLALYPGVLRLANTGVLARSDADRVRDREVALISGGGSGHEPAHAGYIGAGMLSAAVAGEIFTSPGPDAVLEAIRAVAGEAGVLLIVKNYTGDRLNFGLAAEMARAEGIWVDTVVVADDVALARSDGHAGRRGLAGTVLIHKIAGAAAAEAKDLPQVAAIASAAAKDIATMGVSLSAGTSPLSGKPSFTLENEVELGLGIHGEPGVRRIPLRPADELVDELINPVVKALRLTAGERVAALINNLGATTSMELAVAARALHRALQAKDLFVERLYAGTFLSSLDMAGISISLLRLTDERLRWLDAPTTAPAWPNVSRQRPGSVGERIVELAAPENEEAAGWRGQAESSSASRAVRSACAALIAAQEKLTELDRVAGDGDLGTNIARAAQAIDEMAQRGLPDDPAAMLRSLGLAVRRTLGGTSGPLYGVLLLAAGNSIAGAQAKGAEQWVAAMLDGCEAVSQLGGASVGDRTMLDALFPFAERLRDELSRERELRAALHLACEAADRGAEMTAKMLPRRGRASYLGERALGSADAGATAAAAWLRAVAESL